MLPKFPSLNYFSSKKNNNEEDKNNNFEIPTFFDEKKYLITNSYDFKKSIENLQNLIKNNQLISQFNKNSFEEKHFDFYIEDEKFKSNVEFASILTYKLEENKTKKYIKLNDLNYFLPENNQIFEIYFILEERKKILEIKMNVNYEKYTKKIFEYLINKNDKHFNENAKKVKEKTLKNYNKNLNETFSESSETETSNSSNLKTNSNNFSSETNLNNLNENYVIFSIKLNSIKSIKHNKNSEFLFELQNPPKISTNFLIENSENLKKFQNSLFPFRDKNEIRNLIYKNFFILIKLKEEENNKEKNEKKLLNFLNSIFKEEKINKEIIKNEDFEYFSKKELNNIENNLFKKELFYYFQKNIKNFKYSDVYLYLNFFITEEKVENGKIKKVEKVDLSFTKFNYLIYVIVSENILSYFNAIEFMENFIQKKGFKNEIFNEIPNKNYPNLIIKILSKIIDDYQNSGIEFTSDEFINLIKKYYKIIKEEKKENSTNNFELMKLQRILVTPTYVLFTPYIYEKGNRMLREYLDDTTKAIVCKFQNDDFDDGKWNNIILIEFIKQFLYFGITLDEKIYSFFNYTNSQFKNMSCWLTCEKYKTLLKKTGDYSNIKDISKFGARISLSLTTTEQTISIKKENIREIDDVETRTKNKEDGKLYKYTFSDGVGKISYKLAEKIAKDFLKINNVPSAFQGRFLGCKGVWTTMYDDNSENIYIRPSQTKFNKIPGEKNYFDLCDYSRFIKSYLNRQIIQIMNARGIKDEIFLKKFHEYKESLEDEKNIIALIHFHEWSNIFLEMYECGINMFNDRLMYSIILNNKKILYNDLKNRSRIYIKNSAYAIGIMDEYRILNYGEAYLHIKNDDLDIILDQKCIVAKCPCVHPGDLRELTFKRYNENDKSTEKYKIFNKYENVIIFPQVGPRPHPNEMSGSDLDGDQYFIFYDKDLNHFDIDVAPMEYGEEVKEKKEEKEENNKKNNFKQHDIIKYFAEFTCKNNLGIIGDAHMAKSDSDPDGVNGEIPRQIAKIFATAVDAAKTGKFESLTEEQKPSKYPHYMNKNKNKSYHSDKILGKIYDEIEEITNFNMKEIKIENFYDKNLETKNWKNFAFLAIFFYKDYYETIIKILKNNDFNNEILLLSGNNLNEDESLLTKKKKNYDLLNKIKSEFKFIFEKNSKYFFNAFSSFFNNSFDFLDYETFYKNSLQDFASACYLISYDFKSIIIEYKNNKNLLLEFKNLFLNFIFENCFENYNINFINDINDYENNFDGFQIFSNSNFVEENFNDYLISFEEQKNLIIEIINEKEKQIKNFFDNILSNNFQNFNLSNKPTEETLNRILSFPWCISGKILSTMKKLT